MKRLFAAIKIHPNEALTQLVYDLQNACKYDKIKWVDLNNIHITLKFFGETPEEQIPEVNQVLRDITMDISRFELVLSTTGIFGSEYNPRVIWIGIEKNKNLISLGLEILNGLEKIGFKKDRQNFVPHLTIGRIKHIDNKDRFNNTIKKFQAVEIQKEDIDQFYLFESKLFRTGPEYSIIETFHLK